MVTASLDCVNLWNLNVTEAKKIATVPLKEPIVTESHVKRKVMATLDSEARVLVVYPGRGFILDLYSVQPEFGTFTMRNPIDLNEEVGKALKLD
jgi:hypothetical protein